MIDEFAAHLALRARALNLVVCTTGSMTLAATTTGYTRDTGSFLDDGFRIGMEIAPSGFGANPVDVLTGVTDSSLTTKSARAVESSDVGRSILVGLPNRKVWENNAYDPTIVVPYIEDEFAPGTHVMLTAPRRGGIAQETGLYVIKWYLPSGVGAAALRKCVGELKKRYAPGTVCGPVVVDGQPGPSTSQILPVDGGLAVLSLRVPWIATSTNIIAA